MMGNARSYDSTHTNHQPGALLGYNMSWGQTVNTSLIIRDAELTSSTYTRYSFRSGSLVGGLMRSQSSSLVCKYCRHMALV